MKRLILFHNYPTPYRIPFFNQLNKYFDLEVWFTQESSSEGRKWDESLLADVEFSYKIIPSKVFHVFGRPLIYNKGLISLLMKTRMDFLLNIDNFPTIYSLLSSFVVSKIRKKKFILWTAYYPNQHLISHKPFVNLLYKVILFIYRFPLFKFSDLIFTYTKTAKKKLEKFYNKNVFHLPQVYPDSQNCFPSMETKEIIEKKVKTILYIGYLNPWKNVSFLITTFKSFAKENWRLNIVGDGPMKDELQLLAKDDSRIHFAGYLAGPKKEYHLQNADVLVLVSQKDCWGLVVNEAMQYGLPVIVSTHVEAKEMINGNGYVIRQDSQKELVTALTNILTDNDRANKMGKESLSIIKEYSFSNMTRKFLTGLDRIQS